MRSTLTSEVTMRALGLARTIGRKLAFAWRELKRQGVPHLALATLGVVLVGTAGFLLFERGGAGQQGADGADPGAIQRLSNSVWWAFVTIITEGYGDYTARSIAGRVVGMMVMGTGVVLISLMTGVISSVLVARRIREGRGLQPIETSGHIIVCGWNENGPSVLAGIATAESAPPPVALVNELDEDEVNDLKFKFRGRLQLHYVFGDFTSETVLERAGLARARGVILLADQSGEHRIVEADERAIRATLAAKGMAPGVPICVEIIKPDNERSLRRARADDIVVRGRHTGYFLASALLKPGVPQLLDQLLNFDTDIRLAKRPVPPEFADKTFRELAGYFLEERQGILIGLVAEAPGLDLNDILAGDMSSIDQFIKRKFAEAGQDRIDTGRRLDVRLNPPADAVIGENQTAIVITRDRAS